MKQPQTDQSIAHGHDFAQKTSGTGAQPGASPGIGHDFEASDGLHTTIDSKSQGTGAIAST